MAVPDPCHRLAVTGSDSGEEEGGGGGQRGASWRRAGRHARLDLMRWLAALVVCCRRWRVRRLVVAGGAMVWLGGSDVVAGAPDRLCGGG